MKNILSKFNHTITRQNDMFTINYELGGWKGWMVYKKLPDTKYLKDIFILINSYMDDVIEVINSVTPLSGGDLNKVNKELGEYSLKLIHHLHQM